MYATLQLIGDNGEQRAPFNALIGGGGTVGSDLLSHTEGLRPGVSGLSSQGPPLTKKVGSVFANYGWVPPNVGR